MPTLLHQRWSSLGMSTLAFTANFAVWTLFSIIGIGIKEELGLTETQFGMLVAMPILSGAIARLPFGLLTERYGGRIMFVLQTMFVAIPTFALSFAYEYWHYLVLGLFIGLAGGSFAIGVTYCSSWFESRDQGLAMGIFGAGTIGVAITNLVAPLLIINYGLDAVAHIYATTLIVIATLFWVFSYTDPDHLERTKTNNHKTLASQLEPLKHIRVWRFGLYYFFVFGGFLALALWLPRYYVNTYDLDLTTASYMSLAFILPAGIIRAFGGWISDNIGARQVNWGVFWVCIVCLFFLSYPESTISIHGIDHTIVFEIGVNVYIFTFLIFVMGVAMGFGKASIYRLIHDYYPENMGSVGGTVAVMGGLGGFILPILFGIAADMTGIRTSCFMLLYGVLGGCMIWMYYAIKVDEYLERIREARENGFLDT